MRFLIFDGVPSWNLCCHSRFLCGCNAVDSPLPDNGLRANYERDFRAVDVVSPVSLRGVILGLFDGFDDAMVEPYMSDGAVVALDVVVRLWPPGLGKLESDPLFLGQFR